MKSVKYVYIVNKEKISDIKLYAKMFNVNVSFKPLSIKNSGLKYQCITTSKVLSEKISSNILNIDNCTNQKHKNNYLSSNCELKTHFGVSKRIYYNNVTPINNVEGNKMLLSNVVEFPTKTFIHKKECGVNDYIRRNTKI